MEKITTETIRAIFEEAKQTSSYTNLKNVYPSTKEYGCWEFCESLSETNRQNAAKHIANNCNPEKILAVLPTSSNYKAGYVLTDTVFYCKGTFGKYTVSYANIKKAALEIGKENIDGINIELKDGKTFYSSTSGAADIRVGLYFLEQALNKLSELCADMPESERVKTVRNEKGLLIGCIIFLVICFFPARCVVRTFKEVHQEEQEKKVLIAQAEERKRDKSSYETKNLRWFETYGKSLSWSHNYNTDPVLVRIPNVRVFDIKDLLLDDGSTINFVRFRYNDTNIFYRLRDLYYAKARFTIYCEVKPGILTVLMVE